MKLRWRPRVVELDDPALRGLDLGHALGRLAGHSRRVLLDSARGYPSRWSVLGFDPLPPRPRESVFAPRELLASLSSEPGDAVPGPFHGGFLGAFAYDLGAHGERPVNTAPDPTGFERVTGGLYVDFLVRDETAQRTWLVLGEEPGDGRASVEERREQIRTSLARERAPSPWRATPARRLVSSEEHMRRVERCREFIAAGDVYQANLAYRMVADVEGTPEDCYERLRACNPAPYMAFADLERGALLSASPELLLEFDGRFARTRPIKGTTRRREDPEADLRAREELLRSEKDRAELAMIVDLERNDLGRVCRPGRVWVEGFPSLESYARVHHLLADVVGEVSSGVDACDLLAALFPGGSITGAPKLRSMEVIAEIEGEGRGFYCGSLGFVDTRGQAAFNILIRTGLWRARAGGGELGFRVGGGITWLSEPSSEDAETLAKARGWTDVLAGTGVVA